MGQASGEFDYIVVGGGSAGCVLAARLSEQPDRQEHRITADVVVLHQASRGFVTLRSADPADAPRLHLELFSDPADCATARRGIETARRIYATAPQSGLVGAEIRPGAGLTSAAQLDEYIRATSGVTQHPVGTCGMGVGSQAVVDPELRVRGLEGLRVADASVMPTVPGGNTNAAVVMIAERASDLLLSRPAPPPEHVRRRPVEAEALAT